MFPQRLVAPLASATTLVALLLVSGPVSASARPGPAAAAVKKSTVDAPAEPSKETPGKEPVAAVSERRVVDPTELPPMPRKESTDVEGYTIVQLPTGYFRYQREPGEDPEREGGIVTLTPRAPLLASADPDDRPARDERRARAAEKRRRAEDAPAPCRKERALLAQRILALRGMPDVDVDTADLMLSELEGGPSWVATAVLGTGGGLVPRHPAFPWQPAVIVDGQAFVPGQAMNVLPAGATSVTGADPQVRWRLEDLSKCQARARFERELAR